MRVQLQAPFQVSEPMQALIEEKVNKLTTYFGRVTITRVFLKDAINRFHHKDQRAVEIQMEVPGNTLFAEDSAETFEQAIAGAAEKMRRQLKRYKERMQAR